jgi:hypothetical protein
VICFISHVTQNLLRMFTSPNFCKLASTGTALFSLKGKFTLMCCIFGYYLSYEPTCPQRDTPWCRWIHVNHEQCQNLLKCGRKLLLLSNMVTVAESWKEKPPQNWKFQPWWVHATPLFPSVQMSHLLLMLIIDNLFSSHCLMEIQWNLLKTAPLKKLE